MVVHLEGAAELERLAREKQDVSRLVDDDGIRLAQPLPRTEQHLAWCAGERPIVDADEIRHRELARERSGDGIAFEESYRPLHARYAAHARQVGVLESLGLLPVFGLWIHDPDFRI